MMDLIDRQAAIKALEETKQPDPFNRYEYQNIGIDWSIDAITALPSAHPSAEWIERTVSDDAAIKEWQSAKCSACGRYHTTPYMYYFDNYNYCPHCGARMKTLMISAKSWALDELEKKE